MAGKRGPYKSYWTADKVREAYQLWAKTHQGRRPTQADLRYDPTLPAYATVYKLFRGINIDASHP